MLREEQSALSGKSVSDTSDTDVALKGRKPEHELVRYPSGQFTILKLTEGSSFRDVVGNYTNEAEAQKALNQLVQS